MESELASSLQQIGEKYISCRVRGKKSKLSYRHAELWAVKVKKLGIFRPAHYSFYLLLFSGKGEKKTRSSCFSFHCNIHLIVLLFKYQKERCRAPELPDSITGLLMPAYHGLWNNVRGRNQDPNIFVPHLIEAPRHLMGGQGTVLEA